METCLFSRIPLICALNTLKKKKMIESSCPSYPELNIKLGLKYSGLFRCPSSQHKNTVFLWFTHTFIGMLWLSFCLFSLASEVNVS